MPETAVAGRTLPHNLEAERSVLGAILLHNDAFNLAAEVVDSNDFFRDAHRRIHVDAAGDRPHFLHHHCLIKSDQRIVERRKRRDGIRGWVQAKANRSPVYGAGSMEILPDQLVLNGWQRTWLGAPLQASQQDCEPSPLAARAENQDFFRGPVHLARCQAWRARHPGYWRKASRRQTASKDVPSPQDVDPVGKMGVFARTPLNIS